MFLIRRLTAALILTAAATVAVHAQQATQTPASALFNAEQLLADLQTLSADEMEGRSPRQSSIEKSRAYIEKRFKDVGLAPQRQAFQVEQRGKSEPLNAVNIVADIRGTKNPDKFIIVTAHYDHEGIKSGEIYNGADDNASGTAALFTIASYFAKNRPDNSIVFVAFDAEEMGLLGARHFVAKLPVKKEAVLLNVNMDMISRDDDGALYAAGAYHYPKLKPLLKKAAEKATVKLKLGHDDPRLGPVDDWTLQSDHAVFHMAKIPFIYFGVENHKDYHKPTDDFAKIKPAFYITAVETIIHAIGIFDGK
jgi:Zn-dependent M28 family amino/carboxypeptidase